ncbi:hypothetical protein N657DRAFT_683887 [Parathielavia appendiculata]|uniref:Uncharacterized protein n=1 Tax=Parathielavia appendiculata TaxID=2587402 RepID=A0AAN6Z118_9PEZI|nr:hypothetical protein N657DRAFT_683887 [Parathielavia appendiculata]
MGNLFSRHKYRSEKSRSSSQSEKLNPYLFQHRPPNSKSTCYPHPPGPNHRAYHHHQSKIDPRNELYQLPQSASRRVTNNLNPSSRPVTAVSLASSSTLRPSSSNGSYPQRGKKATPSSSKASKARVAPESKYLLEVHCTDCDSRPLRCANPGCKGCKDCRVSCASAENLNEQSNSAYNFRNPSYDRDVKLWKLHVDFCSLKANFADRGDGTRERDVTWAVLTEFVGAQEYGAAEGKAKLFGFSELVRLEARLRSEIEELGPNNTVGGKR